MDLFTKILIENDIEDVDEIIVDPITSEGEGEDVEDIATQTDEDTDIDVDDAATDLKESAILYQFAVIEAATEVDSTELNGAAKVNELEKEKEDADTDEEKAEIDEKIDDAKDELEVAKEAAEDGFFHKLAENIKKIFKKFKDWFKKNILRMSDKSKAMLKWYSDNKEVIDANKDAKVTFEVPTTDIVKNAFTSCKYINSMVTGASFNAAIMKKGSIDSNQQSEKDNIVSMYVRGAKYLFYTGKSVSGEKSIPDNELTIVTEEKTLNLGDVKKYISEANATYRKYEQVQKLMDELENKTLEKLKEKSEEKDTYLTAYNLASQWVAFQPTIASEINKYIDVPFNAFRTAVTGLASTNTEEN